jgi:hypothetical protein
VAILKIARFWPAFHRSPAPAVAEPRRAPLEADALDAFGSEVTPAPETRSSGPEKSEKSPKPTPPPPLPLAALAKGAAVILLTAAVVAAGYFLYQRRGQQTSSTGSLRIETTPPGLDVVLAGKNLGRTPLELSLASGIYDVQLGPADRRRTLKMTVVAGATNVQHIELAAPEENAVATMGTLRVQTEPARLPVSMDGVDRGMSPLTIESVTPGEHEVAVRTEHGTLRRSVKVQPRESVSLIVSASLPSTDASSVAAGWLTVTSPIPLQLLEGGKVIGTTDSDRIMLPAGDHDLQLQNAAFGFQAQRQVKVNAGKVTVTRIDVPDGRMSLNALPWAEVWVDGERVGQTPIGNLTRPIGRHEVLFRHPELGERRETVVVTATQPARLGVDLRKK